MSNRLNLIPGKKYRVVKSFVDYDRIEHKVGEEWFFISTNFNPHADGLTLHVKAQENSGEQVYRLECTDYGQGKIVDNFRDYVEEIN